MHSLSLLTTLTVALVTAAIGGVAARFLRLPATVGYLLAGLVIGPYTPGIVGDSNVMNELAELGVVFLMFGVGLHFSLQDLLKVRAVAIPGALINSAVVAVLGLLVGRLLGWDVAAALLLGVTLSIGSTVVMLRGLADHGLLASRAGQVVVGWLIVEDLLTVLLLIALPIVVGAAAGGSFSIGAAFEALAAAAVFVALMLVAAPRLLPQLVGLAARSGARELIVTGSAAIALGTGYAAAAFFGVSLALGAFLAGLVLARTAERRQVAADVSPLRELLAVIFFVSVGMLVDPWYVLSNPLPVLVLTAVIVLGKPLVTLISGFWLPADGRTMLVAAAGRNQIGEFSFLLAQSGVALGVLSDGQRMIILAAAVLAIALNPSAFAALGAVESLLRRMPRLWQRLNRAPALDDGPPLPVQDHVVIVGYGRVGQHVVGVLQRLQVPCLVVEIDSARADEFRAGGVPTLFGDAANSDVLTFAGLRQARALVVTLPDEAEAALVVSRGRSESPQLPIIARAATSAGVRRLFERGALEVIHPELEGGAEVVRHTLLQLHYPAAQVQDYINLVRDERLFDLPQEFDELERLKRSVVGMQLAWQTVAADCELAGRTLAESQLRTTTGATLIAVIRDRQLQPNPQPSYVFTSGDVIGLIGAGTQVAAACRRLQSAAALLTPAAAD
jgi:monovalent cation:H+ antiporter-2, CPA2 family